MTRTTQPRLRAAVIGAGYTAGFQLAAWSQIQGVDIVTVVDRNRAKAEQRAAEFGIPAVATECHEMLAHESLDFVDIATPPNTHLEMVEAAAAHGVHVLCQKPICTTLADLQRMIRVCREKGVAFAINENCRFQPLFRQARSLIDAGDLGPVHYVAITSRARLSLPRPDFGGQPFMANMPRLIIYELGVHFLDALRYLLGEPALVFAQTHHVSTEIAGEDAAVIMLDVGGATAVVDVSWASAHPNNGNGSPAAWADVRIEGALGTIDIRRDGHVRLLRDSGTRSWMLPTNGVQRGYQELQQHFVDCVRRGTEPETSGADGLRTMELVFGAYDSSEHARPYRVGEDIDRIAAYDLSTPIARAERKSD